MIKLTCRLIIAIIIVVISFTVSVFVGIELLLLVVVMFILSNVYYPKIKKIQEEIKKEADNYIKFKTSNNKHSFKLKYFFTHKYITTSIFKLSILL